MRGVVTTVLAALLAAACTNGGPPDALNATTPPPPATSAPSPGPEATPAERPPTVPTLKVFNTALRGSRPRVAQAIADLKGIGVWRDLTGHLYALKIGSRPGRSDVPEDGHLADAYLRAYIDDQGQGALCDILFFPTALRDDLGRWEAGHASGSIDEPAPTLRQYWAAILAHELAHCLGHGRGEPVARRWEARALAGLRA